MHEYTRDLNPLVIKLSEAPSKITIKHADSTLTLDDYTAPGDNPDTEGTENGYPVDPHRRQFHVATVDFLNIADADSTLRRSQ